jgi:ribosomal RNA-processing protein 17
MGKKEKGRKPKPIVYGRRKASTEYIGYNEKDRQDFVLGFHKRKVEKQKQRVEKAKKKQLEEKREHLREKRKELQKVMSIVDQIDAVTEDSFGPTTQETVGKSTKTTVFISEFDPNEIE